MTQLPEHGATLIENSVAFDTLKYELRKKRVSHGDINLSRKYLAWNSDRIWTCDHTEKLIYNCSDLCKKEEKHPIGTIVELKEYQWGISKGRKLKIVGYESGGYTLALHPEEHKLAGGFSHSNIIVMEESQSKKELEKGDEIIFHGPKGDVKYTVSANRCVNPSKFDNSKIFTDLGMSESEKYALASKCYGYITSSGDWPSCKDNDCAALTRLVDELHRLCADRKAEPASKYKVGDTVTFITPKRTLEYEICECYLGNDYNNDEVFHDLGVDKEQLAKECYGYKTEGGFWPEYRTGDMEAAGRLIDKLQELCAEATKPKAEDKLDLLEEPKIKPKVPTLGEMKAKYPVGTKFNPVLQGKAYKTEQEVVQASWELFQGADNDVWFQDSVGDSAHAYYIWEHSYPDVFAEIVNEAEEESIEAKIARLYPVGTTFTPLLIGRPLTYTVKSGDVINHDGELAFWFGNKRENSVHPGYVYNEGNWATIVPSLLYEFVTRNDGHIDKIIEVHENIGAEPKYTLVKLGARVNRNEFTVHDPFKGKYKVGDRMYLEKGYHGVSPQEVIISKVKSNSYNLEEWSGDFPEAIIRPIEVIDPKFNKGDLVKITSTFLGLVAGTIAMVDRPLSHGHYKLLTRTGDYSFDGDFPGSILELFSKSVSKSIAEPVITQAPIFNYKFKVGDRVKVVKSGSGVHTVEVGSVVEIVELGKYSSRPGYVVNPPIGNSLSGHFESMIGENSFILVDASTPLNAIRYNDDDDGTSTVPASETVIGSTLIKKVSFTRI